jgi:hypothetical protein
VECTPSQAVNALASWLTPLLGNMDALNPGALQQLCSMNYHMRDWSGYWRTHMTRSMVYMTSRL